MNQQVVNYWLFPTECLVSVEVSELSVLQRDDGAVVLSWFVDTSQQVAGFEVLRSADGGPFVLLSGERVRGTGYLSFADESPEVKSGGVYLYKLLAHGTDGETTVYGPIEIVATDRTLPVRFALHRAAPNPIRGTTIIRYDVPRPSNVDIKVYDVAGRLVRTLVSGKQEPGRLLVAWNGLDNRGVRAAAGIYFYRMQTPSFVASQKIVLLR